MDEAKPMLYSSPHVPVLPHADPRLPMTTAIFRPGLAVNALANPAANMAHTDMHKKLWCFLCHR